MTKKQLAKQFINFLKASPTPYHAVKTITEILKDNKFQELKEGDSWQLKQKKRYFVIRGDSSIIAFNLGANPNGFQIAGAHTDSPTLKIKANPDKTFSNYLSLLVEPYGSAILPTWYDRDLSIAGRVSYLYGAKKLGKCLVDFKKPIAVIPNLAIHLNRKVNEGIPINKQSDLCPLVSLDSRSKTPDFQQLLLKEITSYTPKPKEILDYDLQLYDTQSPGFVGYHQEFIAGQRLDNLLSCFASLQALLETTVSKSCMVVFNDHEEVGSSSEVGAAGTFLQSVLERVCDSNSTYRQTIANSLLISADNAHGVHPNFISKHDENHRPILNQGPVIKINANQRYASNSETSAYFRFVCKNTGIPVQTFINRSDMACGSTIGPITATALGIKTLDIGAATFAMHSIRETCGTDDIYYMTEAIKAVFNNPLP